MTQWLTNPTVWVVLLTIVGVLAYLSSRSLPPPTRLPDRPMYLLPNDDKKWKRIVYLEYKDQIFTITSFDHNIKQFWKPMDHHPWYRYPSKKLITDIELQKAVDKLHDKLMDEGQRKGEGWVKSLG